MRARVADSSAPARIALRDVPELPFPGEVLVEVRAFSLNRGELRMLQTASDGWRPGWDFAGVLHSDVAGGPRAGTRVVGIRQGGAWAQRITYVTQLRHNSRKRFGRRSPPRTSIYRRKRRGGDHRLFDSQRIHSTC
jgi:NADPH:quinone reductase-like Zn-dependent oxidoreductase